MDKKRLIISIIIIIIVFLGVFITIDINKEKREINNNMELIKKNYHLLSNSIDKYNEIRNEYTNMSNVLLIDEYKSKHEEFLALLASYDEEIKNIDAYIENISFRCNQIYIDTEVNNICNSYKSLYDKIINLYIADINNYNNIISKYNEYSDEKLEPHKLIHGDIDNTNLNIEGTDNNEN